MVGSAPAASASRVSLSVTSCEELASRSRGRRAGRPGHFGRRGRRGGRHPRLQVCARRHRRRPRSPLERRGREVGRTLENVTRAVAAFLDVARVAGARRRVVHRHLAFPKVVFIQPVVEKRLRGPRGAARVSAFRRNVHHVDVRHPRARARRRAPGGASPGMNAGSRRPWPETKRLKLARLQGWDCRGGARWARGIARDRVMSLEIARDRAQLPSPRWTVAAAPTSAPRARHHAPRTDPLPPRTTLTSPRRRRPWARSSSGRCARCSPGRGAGGSRRCRGPR